MEAQSRPFASHAYQVRPTASNGIRAPPKVVKEYQDSDESCRPIQPLSQKDDLATLQASVAFPTKPVSNRVEQAIDFVGHEVIPFDVKENMQVLGSSKVVPKSTRKVRKKHMAPRDLPEILTKAREPTATQRLSGDLRLLDYAMAALPKDPRNMKEGTDDHAIPNVASEANEVSTPKRTPASTWDRPWRSPPSPRRQTPRKAKRSSLESVEKSKFVNAIESPKGQRNERVESADMAKARAKQTNVDDGKTKTSGSGDNVVASGTGAGGSNTSGIGLSDGNLNLWRMAMDLKIPHDVLKQACDIFKEYAIGDELDAPDKSHLMVANTAPADVMKLSLTKDLFGKVLMVMTGATRSDELPAEFFYETFAKADRDGSEEIDFLEFALWYAKHGFSEEVLLTKEQRMMRDVARKFSMPHSELERFKTKFDEYDLDGSGEIDFGEFQKILVQLLKVPAHLELPAARLKQFWQETDSDGTGTINFEEFLEFYCKRFDAADPDVSPLETFYRGLRPSARGPSVRPSNPPGATTTGSKLLGAEARSRLAVPSFFAKT